MGYTSTAIKGISWLGGVRLSTRAISFLRTAIIARLLAPHEFGLFGIASIVLAMSEILTETGINVFLIQEKGPINKFINTAWVVSIVRGIIITLIIILSAPFIATFYKSQATLPIILAISIVPLLRGFINPSIIKFQKELKFNKEFYFRTSIFLVDAIVSVVAIFLTKSPMGIVVGLISGIILELVLSHLIVRPNPKFDLDKNIIKQIFSRGKWVTSFGIFNYLFHNGDTVIVGKMLGINALGIYDMAYRISMLPITEISDVVTRVTFPVYIKFAEDYVRLKRAFLKTLLVTSAMGIPISIIFLVFPEAIVNIILGPSWVASAGVLQALALFGVIRAVSSCANPVFLSLGKQNYLALLSLANVMVLFITIIPFIGIYGLPGAAYSAVFSSIITIPMLLILIVKTFKNISFK